jgi:hypothetical protein
MRYSSRMIGLSPLPIVAMAAVGIYAILPANAPEVAMDDIASHRASCAVCMLPLHGRSGETSILGPNPHAPVDVTEAESPGTTREIVAGSGDSCSSPM